MIHFLATGEDADRDMHHNEVVFECGQFGILIQGGVEPKARLAPVSAEIDEMFLCSCVALPLAARRSCSDRVWNRMASVQARIGKARDHTILPDPPFGALFVAQGIRICRKCDFASYH